MHKAVCNIANIVRSPPNSKEIGYQHSAFSQVYFPYKNLGTDYYDRTYGRYRIILDAISTFVGHEKAFRPGVPYGTKARLVLSYLHRQAILNQSPIIDIEGSFSAFVEQVESLRGLRDFRPNGPVMAEYKDQLLRFSTTIMIVGYDVLNNGEPDYINERFLFVKNYKGWSESVNGKNVPWLNSLTLGDEYFQNVMQHGLPLDNRAIASLSHSPMAMDTYTWLAHRLRRVDPNKPQFVAWKNLYDQFGYGYTRIRDFKRAFRLLMNQVLWQYPDARSRVTEEQNKGYWLSYTPPPVPLK